MSSNNPPARSASGWLRTWRPGAHTRAQNTATWQTGIRVLLGVALLASGAPFSSAHAKGGPPPASVAVPGVSGPTVDLGDPAARVGIEALLAQQITFTSSPPLKGKYIALYGPKTRPDAIFDLRKNSKADRGQSACLLDLTGGRAELNLKTANAADLASGKFHCRAILSSVRAGQWSVYVDGRTSLGRMSLAYPASSGVYVTIGVRDGKAEMPSVFASNMAPNPSIYMQSATGAWLSLNVPWVGGAEPMPFPSKLLPLLVGEIQATNRPPIVFARTATGGLREFRVRIQKLTGQAKPPGTNRPVKPGTQVRPGTKPKPGTKRPVVRRGVFSFDAACRAEIAKEVKNTGEDADWFYYLCVDFTDPTSPEYLTFPVGPEGIDITADHDAPHGHIFAGRRIKVRMWYARKSKGADIELSGKIAPPQTLYIDPRISGEGPPGLTRGKNGALLSAGITSRMEEFESSNARYRTLTVSTGGANPSQRQSFTRMLRVEQVYNGALSVGIGFSWAPWDRRYELRTSSTIDNPGKAVGVSEGEGQGLPAIELTLGYVHFFEPVHEHRGNTVFGWLFGVGVLQADGSGIDLITSIHTGPAIAIGRDFSIVASVSLRRTEWLIGGNRVGSAVPNSTSEVPTSFGVTPGFGIIVNFSPALFDAIGKVTL